MPTGRLKRGNVSWFDEDSTGVMRVFVARSAKLEASSNPTWPFRRRALEPLRPGTTSAAGATRYNDRKPSRGSTSGGVLLRVPPVRERGGKKDSVQRIELAV